ncbi:MAG TPA: hypothetical protein VER17_11965 [Tepidisphaeraceae bacterium]|nr:hypothetical protein [Tepidisphaeraceae bacterium]
MTTVDYVILGSYLLFLLAMGPAFKSFSTSASDFFRAGGAMIWWVAGCAVIMGGFSAWSFTGGAAKAYDTGFFFLVLFACNFVATCFQYFLADKFRQMRVVTPVEAIRKRFGPVNEQVFTWIPVPISIVYSGIGLYTLAVFVSGAFGMSHTFLGYPVDTVTLLIVAVGVTVVLMAVVGGAWAVNASQFVQGLIFITITIVMVYTTLSHPKIGGLGGLLAQLPSKHWNWTEFARPGVLAAFMVTLLLNQFVQMNAINAGAAKFITVKSGRDARRVVLMSLVAMVVMTPMWMIPPLGSVIVHPDLRAEYPALKTASEAAYVAMAQTTLPPGLLGLLICAIFSASLDNLSGGVNGSAAVLVRNFYIRWVNPRASDRRQILVGRGLSLGCGALMILIALTLTRFESVSLFNLILMAAASFGLPQAVPLFLGLFVRRAPFWSLWSTVAVGFATSLALRFSVQPVLGKLWTGANALSAGEMRDLDLAVTTGVLLLVCTAWFMATALLGRQSPREREAADAFFTEMHTPIDMAREHGDEVESDEKQYRVLAILCLVYGGFILLMTAVPNSSTGRIGLAFCGGTIAAVGAVLYARGRAAPAGSDIGTVLAGLAPAQPAQPAQPATAGAPIAAATAGAPAAGDR